MQGLFPSLYLAEELFSYNHSIFPESACEGFFVKKQPLYYIFTSSHLLI
jgi:hypothetical protein